MQAGKGIAGEGLFFYGQLTCAHWFVLHIPAAASSIADSKGSTKLLSDKSPPQAG